MGLADYKPKVASVSLPGSGGDITVRGLSLDDIAVLMNEHLTDIDGLVAIHANSMTQDARVEEMARFAISIAKDAPALVANVIALAADEPGQVANARRLPLPVQVEILKKILTLTFEEAGGFPKFVESLTMMMAGMKMGNPARIDSPT